MYNLIKIYSSCWERFIDYIYLVENKKLSGKEFFMLLIYQSLFSSPFLAFVFFLLYPLPGNNELSEQTLFYVCISMIAFAFGSSAFSANIIKFSSRKIAAIPSDNYKKHPFIATIVFYAIGILFIFVFKEFFMPLFIKITLITLDLILP
ncbi:TPA: hypothetical protein ACWV4W_005454 [Salmonella enterica subsp. enterica serovar Muenchen]|nr:hypothetical protein [Salmonella enterica subsp. enterica serovar Muenchen]EGL1840090.1 hypothetical protein [Salmonella enterica]EGV6906935.1 hypothetical protein [Salmonella enterica]ELE9460863.1 hypothetical protein [Salmonella enterica]ELF7042484.1 hypothetical protein [Salmonella enterica]